MNDEPTSEELLAAYEAGGVEAVRMVCKPYRLPLVRCESCEDTVPKWGDVCAACWQVIPTA